MKFVLELQKLMVQDNYLIAVRDNFENLLTKSVLKITEAKIKDEGLEVYVQNRVFGVIVECVQNICSTQANSTASKDSVLLMNKLSNGYQICAGNAISAEKKERLYSYLYNLSELSLDEIKEKRLEIMKQKEKLDHDIQEQLSFIELFIRSGKAVNYTFEPEKDGRFFFMIQIDITL